MNEGNWYVYLASCSDDSLYCGITTDPERRMNQHRKGRGSTYVASRLPAELVYVEPAESRSAALQREAEIKSWSTERKQTLVSNSD